MEHYKEVLDTRIQTKALLTRHMCHTPPCHRRALRPLHSRSQRPDARRRTSRTRGGTGIRARLSTGAGGACVVCPHGP
jgi:hypothetical protein